MFLYLFAHIIYFHIVSVSYLIYLNICTLSTSDSTTPCLNIIGMYIHTREGSRKSFPRLAAVNSMLQLPEARSSLLSE